MIIRDAHNDNDNPYTLSYSLDIPYTNLVLLLTEACLFGTGNNGIASLDYNEMSLHDFLLVLDRLLSWLPSCSCSSRADIYLHCFIVDSDDSR